MRGAARRLFFSPRHAQSATARRVRVRVALVVDRVVAMRFASLARSSATAPVSFRRSLPRVVVRSVVRCGGGERLTIDRDSFASVLSHTERGVAETTIIAGSAWFQR